MNKKLKIGQIYEISPTRPVLHLFESDGTFTPYGKPKLGGSLKMIETNELCVVLGVQQFEVTSRTTLGFEMEEMVRVLTFDGQIRWVYRSMSSFKIPAERKSNIVSPSNKERV